MKYIENRKRDKEYYYVSHSINGRENFYQLASRLDRSCIKAEYNEGGWSDFDVEMVLPHLRFTNGEDATAYVLKFGGIVSRKMPTREGMKKYVSR